MSVLSEEYTRTLRHYYRKMDFAITERLVTDLLDTIDFLRAGNTKENKK